MTEKPHDWHYLLLRDVTFGNISHRNVAVGIASIQVLVANSGRKKAVFINDSDTPIYLFKGDLAVLNNGYRLNAAGGSWEECPDTLGYMWVGQWSAISSAANKNLIIIEER